MSTPRTVKHDFVPSEVYANYCGECALSQSDHFRVGPDYVDHDDSRYDSMSLDPEHVADLLTNVVATLPRHAPESDKGPELIGLIDTDEGIIGYIIGQENADKLVALLNDAVTDAAVRYAEDKWDREAS